MFKYQLIGAILGLLAATIVYNFFLLQKGILLFDDGYFPFNPKIALWSNILSWNYKIFPGGPYYASQFDLPLIFVAYIMTSIFHFPLWVSDWTYISLFESIGGIGVFVLLVQTYSKGQKLSILVFGLFLFLSFFYEFNFYTLLTGLGGEMLPSILTYYMIPLIFYYISKYVLIGTIVNRYFILSNLLVLIASFGFYNIIYMILFYLVIIIYFGALLIQYDISVKKMIPKFSFSFITFLLASSWAFLSTIYWTFIGLGTHYNLIVNGQSNTSFIVSSYLNSSLFGLLSNGFSLLPIYNGLNIGFLLAAVIQKAPLLLLPPILVFLISQIPLFKSIGPKYGNLYKFLDFALLAIFLSGIIAGYIGVYGNYHTFLNYAYVFEIFSSFFILVILEILLLPAYTLSFRNAKPSWTKQLISILLVFFLLFSSAIVMFDPTEMAATSPYPTADVFHPSKQFMEVSNFLSYDTGTNNVLFLPITYGGFGSYGNNSGVYVVTNPFSSSTNNLLLYRARSGTNTSFGFPLAENFPSNESSNISNYLSVLGIKYIILDKNTDYPGYPWNFTSVYSALSRSKDFTLLENYNPYYIFSLNSYIPIIYPSQGVASKSIPTPATIYGLFGGNKLTAFQQSIITNGTSLNFSEIDPNNGSNNNTLTSSYPVSIVDVPLGISNSTNQLRQLAAASSNLNMETNFTSEIVAYPNEADQGTIIHLTAIVRNGIPPFHYYWFVNGNGLNNSTQSINLTFSRGIYSISLTVYDKNGNVSSQLFPNGYVAFPIQINTTMHHSVYQQQIVVPDNITEMYLNNSSRGNFMFYSANGTPLYSWLESINQNGMNIWVRVDNNQTQPIFLTFYPRDINFMSQNGFVGEAPQLSPIYGEYFNAPLVFHSNNSYNAWDFVSSFPSGLTTNFNPSEYKLANGLNISFGSDHVTDLVYSNLQYSNGSIGYVYVSSVSRTTSNIALAFGPSAYENNYVQTAVNNTGLFSVIQTHGPSPFLPVSDGGYGGFENVSFAFVASMPPQGKMPTYVIGNPGSLVLINSFPIVSLNSSVNPVFINQSVTFYLNVSGGTPPFTYTWYLNGLKQGTVNSSVFSIAVKKQGVFSINVLVTDGSGTSVKSNTFYEVVVSIPTVKFSRLNEDNYVVHVTSNESFYLVFDQQFSNSWTLYSNGTVNDHHYVANGFANSWLMSKGNYNVTITFRPSVVQKSLYIISFSPVILSASFILYKNIKYRGQKRKLDVKINEK